jgi:hypothetical protein
MIPRLHAEESLLAAARTAVGSGTLQNGVGQKLQREWQATAAGTPVVVGRIGGPLFPLPRESR